MNLPQTPPLLALTPTQAVLDSILRTDFHAFVGKVFKTLNPKTPYNDHWNIELISKRLVDVHRGGTTRLVINVPPRSLKSLICSIAYPAWLLGQDPSATVLCISHTNGLATGFSRQFRRVVKAPWYRRLFPGTDFGKNSEGVLETSAGGGRRAASIEGGLTGYGGDIILIDDPLDGSDAMSAAVRQKVIDTFRGTIFQRLNNKATNKIVLIMQRLHLEDLSGFLLKRGYEHLCLKATATEREEHELFSGRVHVRLPGELLNPAQEPQSALDEICSLMTARDYAAQYQQAPVPDTGDIIKAEWIKRYDTPPDRTDGRVVISWDTGVSGTSTSDYSAATVWLEKGGEHYVIDAYRRQVTQHQQVLDAAELYNRYNPQQMLIESQGSGIGLADFLRCEHGIFAVLRPAKGKKEERLRSASYFFEKGLVYLPRDATWLPDLERELFQQSHDHDDLADTVSQYFIWSHEHGRDGPFADWLYPIYPVAVAPQNLQDVLSAAPRW